LYYTSYRAGNPDVYSHDLQSGTRRAFARYPGLNAGAAPSPDGRRVALGLSKGGSPDIYVCDTDNSNLKQLTKTREAESSPCWARHWRVGDRLGRRRRPVVGAELPHCDFHAEPWERQSRGLFA